MIYARAPIAEAVIDIRFKHHEITDDRLSGFIQSLTDVLPRVARIQSQQLKFGIQPNNETSMTHSKSADGWRLESASGDRVLQIRSRGFTYSHLKPYTNWEHFQKEAEDLLSRYFEVVGAHGCERLGLRYINKINIPGDAIEMEEYFSMYPKVAVERVTGMFMQVRSPLPQYHQDCQALINMAHVPSDIDDHTTILLDIDITVPVEADDCRETWPLFEKMRTAKNDLFENAITDKTRELFK